MTGFNRRFAPATSTLRSAFAPVQGPVNIVYRVNAGRVASSSWVAGDEGGGRIVGEVCHFIDLCTYIAGSHVEEVYAVRSSSTEPDDVIVTLRMTRGSIATIAYMTDGDRAASKERIEVFGGGTQAIVDDFRRCTITGARGPLRLGGRFAAQDKGHVAEMIALIGAATAGGPSPVPFESAVHSTNATFAAIRSLEIGCPVRVDACE